MTTQALIAQAIDRDVAVAYRHDHAYARRRRIFDVVVSSAALVLAAPVLGAAAVAIWLEDRGPALFKQKRVGQYGRLFTIYKLRTMRLERCEDALSPKTGTDARISRVGKFLRKYSIDELPQLFNALRGDVAIVGPRPEMPFLVQRYERWQHLRHLSKPGITGLWQITCRKQIPLHEPAATKIDLEYLRSASSATDGSILLRTFAALFNARGAY